jgi:protein-S-isoprenylcysteine O-methyltransferase Ste14
MRRASALFVSALFLFIAPGFIAGLVPWWISQWRFEPRPDWWIAFRIAGALLILTALPVLLECFARFALQGLGTPAPVFPTKHLLVKGRYRYVRNPMYVAVVTLILGQSLLFGNIQLFEYGAAIWLAFHLFVLVYEEPTLPATFEGEYQLYCAKVRRWIPSPRPWNGDALTSSGSPDPN